MATAAHSDTHATDHGHDDHHHEEPFWRKYMFSTDHKMIGMQYGYCALAFLAFGFLSHALHALEHRLPR